MFHERKRELSFLNTSYQSIGGQFLVLYGRKNTGKTSVLLAFARGKGAVYYSCGESTAKSQLSAFSALLYSKSESSAAFGGYPHQRKEFTCWNEAFAQIPEFPGKGKKILILDDFTYLLKSSPGFLSNLKELWETRLKYENVMIILCGSNVPLIRDELLDVRRPLRECATGIMEVSVMDYYESVKFLPGYSAADKLAVYSILGGVPYYLSAFDPRISFERNVKEKLLAKNSPLYTEPLTRLRQDLREISIYNAILESLALGNNKLAEIYQQTLIEKSKLTVYLRNLTDLGIVEREFPVYDGLREQAYVQHGLYRLSDQFFRFWYSNIFPNFSDLEEGRIDFIYSEMIKPRLAEYASEAFVRACRDYLKRRNASEQLPFHFSNIGRFWDKTGEFSIMASDTDNANFFLADCCSNGRIVTLPYLNRTITKFKAKKKGPLAYYYCIFSLSGFAEEVKQPALRQGIELVSGTKMFSAY